MLFTVAIKFQHEISRGQIQEKEGIVPVGKVLAVISSTLLNQIPGSDTIHEAADPLIP